MRKMTGRVLAGAAMVVVSSIVWAAGAPRAISPGSEKEILAIGSRCPTFSWISAEKGESVELVVYRLPDEGSAADSTDGRPVIRRVLPGEAQSWTPELGLCLEAGARYAWSLKSVGRQGASRWSPPSLFRVRSTSPEEVEEALEVLRAYLERQGEAAELPALLGEALGSVPVAGDPTVEGGASAPGPEAGGIETGGIAPALPAGFEAGLVAEQTGTTSGTVGVQGLSSSAVEGSTGVWGESLALSGKVAGVKGTTFSVGGWGGYFQNYWWLGVGLFAGGGPHVVPPGEPPILSADLVLGGHTAQDDAGTIFSDPRFPSSDLILFSNDAIRLHLDLDGSGEAADFKIFDKDFARVFSVDQSGNAVVSGDLTVEGTPGGNLQSAFDVAVAVAAAIEQHEEDLHPNFIFVTSTTHTGNVGGLSGGDTICRQRAVAGGLPGLFIAWLSGNDAAHEARDRMSADSTSPYFLPDGTKVADDRSDLLDGVLLHAINKNEFGATVTTFKTAYTNTKIDGSLFENTRDCAPASAPAAAWTAAGVTDSGHYGDIDSIGATWTSFTNDKCSIVRRLYCVSK